MADRGRFLGRSSPTCHEQHAIHSVGTGYPYQGTYESISFEEQDHLDTVLHDVEWNAVRPTMVDRAENWNGNSLWRWLHPTEHQEKPILCPRTIPRPKDRVTRVNRALTKKERGALQAAVVRGRLFGEESWQQATAKQLGLESTFRARRRPKKSLDDSKSSLIGFLHVCSASGELAGATPLASSPKDVGHYTVVVHFDSITKRFTTETQRHKEEKNQK